MMCSYGCSWCDCGCGITPRVGKGK